VLYTPAITHPAEHISHEAIGYALDWFGKTLQGGTPLPAGDQIWFRKEIGTGIALLGFVAFLIGMFDGLLEARMFARLILPEPVDGSKPAETPVDRSRWLLALILSVLIPALTYYPAFTLAGNWVKASPWLPQAITNQIVVWALINAAIALILMPFAPKRASRRGIIGLSIAIALATVASGYLALWLADLIFTVDFRFWIVALKLMNGKQAVMALIYLAPITAFFVIALHVMHRNFSTLSASRPAIYLTNIAALALGFVLLLAIQYGALWLNGQLIDPAPAVITSVPLNTIVAIQFVPLMAIVAVIATFTWRRTGSSLPGALICSLLVTWYVVAGTATQAAF
jgi:MFS family permease